MANVVDVNIVVDRVHIVPVEQNKIIERSCKKRITDLSKTIVIFIKSFFNFTNYTISHINLDHLPEGLQDQLNEFEKSFTYPFSEQERFRIKHGKNGDYFAFFRQLGKVHYFVAKCKTDKTITKMINGNEVNIEHKAGEIAAVACAILRTIQLPSGKRVKAWYICDLKVGEKYQGEHLPIMMLQKGAWRILQCPRGFGICMNPANKEPKAAKIWQAHSPLKGRIQTLNLFSLGHAKLEEKKEEILKAIQESQYKDKDFALTYHSTSGKKDYLIFKEDSPEVTHPWKLVHLRHQEKDKAEGDLVNSKNKDEITYMLSAVEGSEFDVKLKQVLGEPSSSAQIVSYGMEGVDFNFLSSDQI